MAFLTKYKWWLASVAVVLCLLIGVCLWLPQPVAEPILSPETTTPLSTTPASVTETTTTASETTESTESSTTKRQTTTSFTTTTAAPKVKLTVTSHPERVSTTDESVTTFTGTSDPKHPLTINGKAVKRDELGAFSVEYDLKIGKNTFTFSHKGKQTTYTVHYRYVVMQSYSPAGSRQYLSGANFSVVVSARAGSTVTATFRGKTITLKQTGQGGDGDTQQSETFVKYSGTFTLPSDNVRDLNLGAVTFKATHRGQTDTGKSGNIVCKKAQKKVIGEVVSFSAETFDGDKSDDDSRPTNNYFPKGTVDYVVGHAYFGDKEYLLLRCGRRVYVNKQLSPPNQTVAVTKEYAGTLPDTNTLSLAELQVTADATYLTLNTDWKAPFFLDLLPQKYKNPATQDYRVTSVTYEYVEITFCYATGVSGDFDLGENHPLFRKATVQKDGDDTVLRLYLRQKGSFYGWDASYNEKGQLVFYFLHPAQVKTADNAYGADLTGVTVMLDVGHGAKSVGAAGLDSDHPEGERNYYLATLVKKELESIGATVVLNRTATGDLNADQRCLALKKLKPDICIAIHHDANVSSKPNGFGSFYSLPYAYEAAKQIYNATMVTGIYPSSAAGNRNRLAWHYYFVARMSDCPVVLTENGFMTSPIDHQGIVSDLANWQKAQAITKGIAKYFLSIRIPGYVPPTPSKSVIIPTTTKTTTTTTEETITTTKEESTTTTLETTTEPTTSVTEVTSTTETTSTVSPTENTGDTTQTEATNP